MCVGCAKVFGGLEFKYHLSLPNYLIISKAVQRYFLTKNQPNNIESKIDTLKNQERSTDSTQVYSRDEESQ